MNLVTVTLIFVMLIHTICIRLYVELTKTCETRTLRIIAG